MQRVAGMACVSKAEQQHAYEYALKRLDAEASLEEGRDEAVDGDHDGMLDA